MSHVRNSSEDNNQFRGSYGMSERSTNHSRGSRGSIERDYLQGDEIIEDSEEESPVRKPTKKKSTIKLTKLGRDNKEKKTVTFNKSDPKSNIRIICWTMVYPSLLKKAVKKVVLLKKKKTLIEMPKKIDAGIGTYVKYIMDAAGTEIEKMFKSKEFDFIFVNPPEKVVKRSFSLKGLFSKKNEPNQEKEIIALLGHFQVILDKLITYTKKLPNDFFYLLSTLTENGAQLPDEYFSPFEIFRLQFSHYGSLKNVLQWHSKILIGGLVLVRMFLYGVIMQHQEVLGTNDDYNQKALNIGSVFYNIIMEHLKGLAPILHQNQTLVMSELKVLPRQKLQLCMKEEILRQYEIKIEKEPGLSDIMNGFYKRDQLGMFFKNKNKNVEKVKALVAGWVDGLYEHSHERWLQDQRERVGSKTDL